MESITQLSSIKKSIDTISLNIYKITSLLNVLELLKEVPNNIQLDLYNTEFLNLLSDIESKLSCLNEFLEPLIKKVSKALYKQKQSNSKDEPYAGFKVDEKPLSAEKLEITHKSTKSFEELNADYKEIHNKDIKPINRKVELPYKGDCPYCGASNNYIYNNNNVNQCKCKACHNTFSYKTKFYNEVAYYCPHCHHKLEAHHDRNNYIVYICRNNNCSYYLNSLKTLESNPNELVTTSNSYKLHYSYRAFKFTMDEVNKNHKVQYNTKINLSNAHHSPHVIGTILTYYVNYGLSTRKTAKIMKEIHGISISHQTIMNYAEAVASYVQNLVVSYPYELSHTLVGDETYIKVRGKSNYVFFFSDPTKKIITSWKIYNSRDTKNAVESLLMSFNKYKQLPDDLLVITDGNPIYNAAQVFLSMNDINFDLQQVIGVSNKDETSIKYRPFKQIEERLNRTYKQNYYGTHGYHSLLSANIYMILFVTFFNFLRTHSTLNYKAPVELDELKDIPLMPDKWIKLINLSKSYIN